MKITVFAIMAILTTVMLISTMPVTAPLPRHCKGLDIYFYETPDAAFAALLAGEIDFMDWSLTYEQYLTACATPDLQLAGYAENGMMEFDINNNYTIPDYPGIRSPTNELAMRRALACMTDRDWIVNEVCMGFAEGIYCPICAPQMGYGNESCCFEETYPYPYDLEEAQVYLAGSQVLICQPTTYEYTTYCNVEQTGVMHVISGDVRNRATGFHVPVGVDVAIFAGNNYHVDDYDGAVIHWKDPANPNRALARCGSDPAWFPVGADGWRYFDINRDGVKDPDEDLLVKTCIRSDHGHRLTAGRALADNMRTCYVPVNQIEASSDVLYPMVMDDRNFHIYTGGWSFGRRPTYLWGLFHSDNWFEGGSNYCTGMNSSNLPNYPDLDDDLHDVRYAATIEEFTDAVKAASGKLVCDYCCNIPLWSYTSYWAYRKVLVGVVNKKGYGPQSEKDFLTAYKCDDPATPQDESQEPIRFGPIYAPKDLNILYSKWYYDYAVLDRVFTHLLQVNPYNLAIDQPWIAQDWEVSTWYDEHEPEPEDATKTKVTYWIRKDVWWHAPVTGETTYQFTAHDVEFTIWYIANYPDCSVWPGFKDVHHTVIVNDFCIEVYFDVLSIWAYDWIGRQVPLLPKYEYLPLLCEQRVAEVHVDEPVIPSDYWWWTDDWVVQIEEAWKDGVIPLYEGIDYEIVWESGCHNWIHWLRPLDPSQTITFVYWTPVVDPHGYYLGSLDWSLTFYTLGTHYPIAITPGVGGFAIFNCNPTHFLGAPPLGEIDWKWYWVEGPKPRSGYYQVNLYDAVYLLSAYCSRGDGAPPPNWFPGADIDCYDLCHVGLYDAVMLLSNYGAKFGIPPDP